MEVAVAASDSLWSEKDKDARLNYTFKLDDLLSAGDRVTACAWDVQPAGQAVVESSALTDKSVSVLVSGGVPRTWYSLTATYETQAGQRDNFTFRLFIKEDAEAVSPLGSALFPNRFTATSRLRNDRLMLAVKSVMPDLPLSDEYLWDKLRAAESEIGHMLRVPLAPTKFFPHPPSQVEIDALNGKPYAVDPAYDYDPDFFQGEKWGFLVTRQKPIISVDRVRFVYPAPTMGFYEVPADWLRLDRKAGHIRFVPASSPFVAPLNAFILQALGGGRSIPFAIEVTYTAGLENAARDYPELIDVVMKSAALKVIEDAFLPQSGSISADGLSQSISVDVSKYHEMIDTILNGAPGTNGGLMTAIHGVRAIVMGA